MQVKMCFLIQQLTRYCKHVIKAEICKRVTIDYGTSNVMLFLKLSK